MTNLYRNIDMRVRAIISLILQACQRYWKALIHLAAVILYSKLNESGAVFASRGENRKSMILKLMKWYRAAECDPMHDLGRAFHNKNPLMPHSPSVIRSSLHAEYHGDKRKHRRVDSVLSFPTVSAEEMFSRKIVPQNIYVNDAATLNFYVSTKF